MIHEAAAAAASESYYYYDYDIVLETEREMEREMEGDGGSEVRYKQSFEHDLLFGERGKKGRKKGREKRLNIGASK